MANTLVVRPGALGDSLLALPALGLMRAAHPSNRLTFVGNPSVLSLLSVGDAIDSTVSIDAPELAVLFTLLDKPLPELAAMLGNPDRAVVWLRDSAVIAENLRRLGARTVVAAPGRPSTTREHVSDYLVRTLGPLLSPTVARTPIPRPKFRFNTADESFAAAWWQRHRWTDRQVLAVHPGSGGIWKCWSAARFAAVASEFAARGGAILLVAGPADDLVVSHFLASVSNGDPVLADSLSLPTLAALLSRCAAFVGNDSGISHLAAAVGTPVVAIYGPTDPTVWGVRGERVALLRGETLDAVSIGEVMAAILSVVHSGKDANP